jgi:hypothetical protein
VLGCERFKGVVSLEYIELTLFLIAAAPKEKAQQQKDTRVTHPMNFHPNLSYPD